MAEHQLPKLGVGGSSPLARFFIAPKQLDSTQVNIIPGWARFKGQNARQLIHCKDFRASSLFQYNNFSCWRPVPFVPQPKKINALKAFHIEGLLRPPSLEISKFPGSDEPPAHIVKFNE